MILMLLLCIELSILHLCVNAKLTVQIYSSDLGYECAKDESRNDPQIFLIKDDNRTFYDMDYMYQSDLAEEFHDFCNDYYNITIGSFEEAKKHTNGNVIQFAVPNYYDGKLLENFVYAGNVSKIDDAVCTKTGKVEPQFDCSEIVNLVSPSVKEINDGHIYDIVQEMHLNYRVNYKIRHREICEPPFQKTSDLTIVLLCDRSNYDKKVNVQPLKLIQIHYLECSYYINKKWWLSYYTKHSNRLLAVLAPEPFELPSEYSVPTIFYEAPYMYSENMTAFPNSMNLVPWRLLKYGFLKFIQSVGWQRVAIVTDDSEYSIDFEEELTALLNKERLVYTVIRCEDANCEMNKIAQELTRVSARIVIANVEEKHAEYLFEHASHKITWLFRDTAGKKHTQYFPRGQDAFSFSLVSTNTKKCDVDDNILTGLSSIAQAYKNITNEDHNVTKREFYRRFAEKVKQTTKITEAIIIVERLQNSERIASMSVNENGAEFLLFYSPYKNSDRPTDGTAHCLVSTYDYHKPCGDPVVMFMTFILMMFVLTFLLIACYFEKTSPLNESRYQIFY